MTRVVEYIIRAKSAVGEGINAALSELRAARAKGKEISNADIMGAALGGNVPAAAGKANAATVAAAGGVDRLSYAMSNATQIGMSFAQVTNGNVVGGMGGMVNGINGLLPKIAGASSGLGALAAAAAMVGGYMLGKKLDEWTHASDKLAAAFVGKAVPALQNTRTAMDKLNASSLARMVAEISTVTATADKMVAAIDRANDRTGKQGAVKAAAANAAIDLMPEGYAKDEARAEAERAANAEQLAADKAAATAKLEQRRAEEATLTRDIAEASAKRAALEKDFKAKETSAKGGGSMYQLGEARKALASWFESGQEKALAGWKERQQKVVDEISDLTFDIELNPAKVAVNEAQYDAKVKAALDKRAEEVKQQKIELEVTLKNLGDVKAQLTQLGADAVAENDRRIIKDADKTIEAGSKRLAEINETPGAERARLRKEAADKAEDSRADRIKARMDKAAERGDKMAHFSNAEREAVEATALRRGMKQAEIDKKVAQNNLETAAETAAKEQRDKMIESLGRQEKKLQETADKLEPLVRSA